MLLADIPRGFGGFPDVSGAPERILYPTDFSHAGSKAFIHALRLAVAMRARLYQLHVSDVEDFDESEWEKFPLFAETLARWGMIEPFAPRSTIAERLGVQVSRELLVDTPLRRGISQYALDHGCDLLVMATHERHGLRRLLEPSIAEDVYQLARIPTLFLPERSAGFVDAASGAVHLDTVLIPIDEELTGVHALRRIQAILRPVSSGTRVALLHVGAKAPPIVDETGAEFDVPIEVRQGPVVETILRFARETAVDLIAMPTEGRHGFLDGLRGSTTERVLHEANCPVLTVPASGVAQHTDYTKSETA
jgi:nucleotide-binding universal stress UspA family protein